MNRYQTIAIMAFFALLVAGAAVIWFVPWPDFEQRIIAFAFLGFAAILAAFAGLILQVGNHARALRESVRKPALRLEVLPPLDRPGAYGSKKVDRIVLVPQEDDPSTAGARVALRIENTGSQAASRVYLMFILLRKGKSGGAWLGKLTVDYRLGGQNFVQAIYSKPDTRAGYHSGWTLRLPESLIVYSDPYNKPIVAEIDLSMEISEFEPESNLSYEIHYRIHSYEGNRYLDLPKANKAGRQQIQVYPLTLAYEAGPAKSLETSLSSSLRDDTNPGDDIPLVSVPDSYPLEEGPAGSLLPDTPQQHPPVKATAAETVLPEDPLPIQEINYSSSLPGEIDFDPSSLPEGLPPGVEAPSNYRAREDQELNPYRLPADLFTILNERAGERGSQAPEEDPVQAGEPSGTPDAEADAWTATQPDEEQQARLVIPNPPPTSPNELAGPGEERTIKQILVPGRLPTAEGSSGSPRVDEREFLDDLIPEDPFPLPGSLRVRRQKDKGEGKFDTSSG